MMSVGLTLGLVLFVWGQHERQLRKYLLCPGSSFLSTWSTYKVLRCKKPSYYKL